MGVGKMKMLKHKKAQMQVPIAAATGLGAPTILFILIAGTIAVFGATGFIKFLVSDKTPFILVGVFVLLILARRRNG
jgi:hypothetical protein